MDRLLSKQGYDCSREIRVLELLKLRFGEAPLHSCEVLHRLVLNLMASTRNRLWLALCVKLCAGLARARHQHQHHQHQHQHGLAISISISISIVVVVVVVVHCKHAPQAVGGAERASSLQPPHPFQPGGWQYLKVNMCNPNQPPQQQQQHKAITGLVHGDVA